MSSSAAAEHHQLLCTVAASEGSTHPCVKADGWCMYVYVYGVPQREYLDVRDPGLCAVEVLLDALLITHVKASRSVVSHLRGCRSKKWLLPSAAG